MSRYLLDSDVSIDLMDGVPKIVSFISQLTIDGISISAVTFMEMYQGDLLQHGGSAPASALRAFLATVPVFEVSFSVAERCAEIRADLYRRGRSVRPRSLDLLIAATALTHGLTLVTRNASDFNDIPGLPLLTPPS